MSDKIINVESPEHRAELERRQHQRRREDQVRTLEQAAEIIARERRYEILQASVTLMNYYHSMSESIHAAERMLEIIEANEKRERERQGKDETK